MTSATDFEQAIYFANAAAPSAITPAYSGSTPQADTQYTSLTLIGSNTPTMTTHPELEVTPGV